MKIHDVLKKLDNSIDDYYNKFLEQIEEKDQIEEMNDFFYFKKQIEGYYQYHLFPKLDLNLIEDQ